MCATNTAMCLSRIDPLAEELAKVEKRVINAYRWMEKEPNIERIKKFYPVAEKLIERRAVLRRRMEEMERIKHAGK